MTNVSFHVEQKLNFLADLCRIRSPKVNKVCIRNTGYNYFKLLRGPCKSLYTPFHQKLYFLSPYEIFTS